LIRLAASSLAVAFICLVLSSQLAHPNWIVALAGVALFVAVAVLFALAFGLGKVPVPRWAAGMALPVVASALALGLRGWLLDSLTPPEALPRVEYLRMQLGAGAAVGALFALISGVALLSRGGHAAPLVVGGLAVASALFVAGPLLVRAGVPLDHRTFLGLAGLGVGAYAVVEARRRIGARGER